MASTLDEAKTKKEGLILVNKPPGISSFAVVAKVRKVIGVSKVGHAGTLDPLALGLMIILIGKNYTKKAHTLIGLDKTYSGQIMLGQTSSTDDREGLEISNNVMASSIIVTKDLSLDHINHFMLLLSGSYQQLPPQFSAKKVNGQRSYHRARAGKYTDLKPKLININIISFKLKDNVLDFKMSVSSGTYIRSFARDIGKISGLGGYLNYLHRDKIGDYNSSDAIDWEQL